MKEFLNIYVHANGGGYNECLHFAYLILVWCFHFCVEIVQ